MSWVEEMKRSSASFTKIVKHVIIVKIASNGTDRIISCGNDSITATYTGTANKFSISSENMELMKEKILQGSNTLYIGTGSEIRECGWHTEYSDLCLVYNDNYGDVHKYTFVKS